MTSFTRVDRRRSEMLSQDWSEATTAGKFLYTTNRVRYLRGRLDEYYLYPCALAPQQVNSLMDKTCQEKPTACASVKCEFYADCQVKGQGTPMCVCPSACEEVPKQSICGNDGQTYQNECFMRKISCENKRLITKSYDGECEYNLFFGGKSYQAIQNPDFRLQTRLEFTIRPENDNGILFYSADRSRASSFDFLSVSLADGYVDFKFDNGKGHAHIRSNERLSRNQWNTVIASRTGQNGMLIVNGGAPKSKSSPGSLTQLNVDTIGYLGGLGPNPRASDIKYAESSMGYQGCIKKLSVNNNEVNLRFPGPSVKAQVNVLSSCGTSPCAKKPCFNGATCFATSAKSYQCRCPVGFRGTHCETRVYILPQIPAYFNGQSSFIGYRQLLDTKHKHDIIIQFRSEQADGLLLYAQGPAGVRDYFAVSLQNRRVVCSFDLGSGNTTLTSQKRFKLDSWTNLRISRHDKRTELFFNQRRVAYGITPGDSRISNLHTVMYIGKADKLITGKKHHSSVYKPFKGCIRKLQVDDLELKFRQPDKYLLTSADVSSCAECYQDIAISFVIDTSSFVGSDGFDKTKQFVDAVIRYYDTTKFSIIDFANTAKLQIPFNRAGNVEEMTALVSALTFRNELGHRMSEGLKLAHAQFGNVQAKSKYVVLITAADPKTSAESQEISVIKKKLKDSGSRVFVVGVGNDVTLGKMTPVSSDGNIYIAASYDDIIGYVIKLRKNLCKLSS